MRALGRGGGQFDRIVDLHSLQAALNLFRVSAMDGASEPLTLRHIRETRTCCGFLLPAQKQFC